MKKLKNFKIKNLQQYSIEELKDILISLRSVIEAISQMDSITLRYKDSFLWCLDDVKNNKNENKQELFSYSKQIPELEFSISLKFDVRIYSKIFILKDIEVNERITTSRVFKKINEEIEFIKDLIFDLILIKLNS